MASRKQRIANRKLPINKPQSETDHSQSAEHQNSTDKDKCKWNGNPQMPHEIIVKPPPDLLAKI